MLMLGEERGRGPEGEPGVLAWCFTSLVLQHLHGFGSGLFTLETRPQTRRKQTGRTTFQNKSLSAKRLF